MTQQFSNRGIYENVILSLTCFDDYIVETCLKISNNDKYFLRLYLNDL